MPPASVVAAQAPDTRHALVEAATEMVQTRGFCAFSYRDLAERIGIRTASIHYHFPSKENLGVAVVVAMRDRLHGAWAQLESAHPQVDGRLRALFNYVKEVAAFGDRICPMGSLQAEFAALPGEVQRALADFSEEYAAHYARWLDEGRRAGQLTFLGSPRAMAIVMISCMQAVLQRHRSNPKEDAGEALDQMLLLLGVRSSP